MKKIKILIVIILVLISGGLLVNGLINEGKQDVVEINNTTTQISNTTTQVSTTTTANNYKQLQTTKKVVKTTKKTTAKKIQKFNIKYNRQEVIDYTHQEVVKRWGEDQWEATYKLVMHESGFNPNSVNTQSGACGVFQANPCSKVIKYGYKDYYTNWKTQVNWGLDFIAVHKRYGTPKKAWAYWKKHGCY